MFDDTYEVDYQGAADLKKDQHYHARTSFESLKRFAQVMAATPVDTVKRSEVKGWMRDPYKRAPNKAQYWPVPNTKARAELDYSRSWLLTHAHELPAEIENEKGQTSSRTTFEIPEAVIRDKEKDKDAGLGAVFQAGTRTFVVSDQGDYEADDNASKYEAHGRFHLERNGCNASLESVLRDIIKATPCPVHREYLTANPTSRETRLLALKVRGARYVKFAEAQATRNKWRGMEEYAAVGKASDKIDEGIKRRSIEVNAIPLPDMGRLCELFHMDGGTLVRTRLNRAVTGKQVEIDKVKYVTERIAYALTTGSDPQAKMVRDGVATQYCDAKGIVTVRQDGKVDARVTLNKEVVTIGEYKTKAQAQEACRLYLRTLERWG